MKDSTRESNQELKKQIEEQLKDDETKKAIKKQIEKFEGHKDHLAGFSKIADNYRVKLQNMYKRKNISCMLILGHKNGGSCEQSGGIVGEAEVLLEAIYNLATDNPEIKVLIEVAAEALKMDDLRKLTKLTELEAKGEIREETVRALRMAGITDLKQVARRTRQELCIVKNIGTKTIEELEKQLNLRRWSFKGERIVN